jgi:hypothetical protein
MNPVGLPMLPIFSCKTTKLSPGVLGVAACTRPFPDKRTLYRNLLSLVEKRKEGLEPLGVTRRSV